MSSKSFVDANRFIYPDKVSAYLLGFIWADAYLCNTKSNPTRISIEITSEDFITLSSLLIQTGKWSEVHRVRTGRKPQSIGVTCNKDLYSFLLSMDYDKKSCVSQSKILDYLSSNLRPYWIRGYFDGDGCWYYNQVNYTRHMTLCSSYEQDWNYISTLLSDINVKHKVIRRIQGDNKHSVIRSSDIQSLMNFGNYIYTNEYDNIGLKRKHDKYIKLCGGLQV